MALKDSVKRELSQVGVDVQMKESPVDEHESNGHVESAVRQVQEQVRTMRLALEHRYKMEMKSSPRME